MEAMVAVLAVPAVAWRQERGEGSEAGCTFMNRPRWVAVRPSTRKFWLEPEVRGVVLLP